MKKATLLFCLLITCTVALFAQDVKIKKDIILINDVEELSKDKGNLAIEKTKCLINSVKTNKPLFSIYVRRYVEVGKAVLDINFVDFDGTCRLTTTIKNLYAQLYKMEVIDKDGKVNEEKARTFIRTFNERDTY